MSFEGRVVMTGAGGVAARSGRRALWVALVCVVFPAGALAAPYDTLVSSRSSGEGPPDAVGTGEGGPSGTPVMSDPVISASGRYVAFSSAAPNLVPGDTNVGKDVFMRDHGSFPPTTTIVGRASDSGGLPGAQAAGISYPTSMSANGRYVVFTSWAGNLVAGDSGNSRQQRDVFVRDRDPDADGVFDEGNATTALVSAKPDGTPANNESDEGSISADGRYVAFTSEASGLVAGGNTRGVFVRDRDPDGDGVFDEVNAEGKPTATTAAVSPPDRDGPSGPLGGGREPSISADGRFVAFAGGGDNPDVGDSNGKMDVFLRDLGAQTTRLVSRADSGEQGDGASRRPSISGNGRFVAFYSAAGNLVAGDVNGKDDVFVRDLRAGTLRLVSRASDSGGAPGAPGIGFSQNPSISGDGRFVAFDSSASNLVAGDGNGREDVFVRDLLEGKTRLESRSSPQAGAPEGVPANNNAAVPVLASGGGFVAFGSGASNLVTGDVNGIADIFRRELGPVPALPSLSVGDVSVGEGNAGEVDARFVVSLSRAVGQAVVVDFTTANESASAGEDYVAGNGSVVIPAGQTSGAAVVRVKGDTLDEPDERFFVNLTGPQGASVADGQGVGTIVDDDEVVPGVSVGDVSVSEGDSGEVDATFAVSLSGPAARAVSVAFATADDSAVAPGDYTAASGTVAFAAGETTRTVTVKVRGDTVVEAQERFLVRLSSPQGVAVVDGEGVGTIADNDAAGPGVSVGDVSVSEGDSGEVDATFAVSLSGPAGRAVSVDFATADDSAVAPGDYTAASGTVTFAAGETSKTVTVKVRGDTVVEAQERFLVRLANPQGVAVVDGEGVGTIADNDAAGGDARVSVGDVSVSEGDSGEVDATFAVSLSGPAARAVSVDFATADDTAVAPGDYTAASGTVTFAAGETSKTVTVKVKGDTVVEAQERFLVRLANPQGVAVLDGEGVGTIADNDAADPDPRVSISDAMVTEGDSGAVQASFEVSLSAVSGSDVVVDFATANDSATAPADYEARSGSVTIPAGQMSRTVTVAVAGDTLDEPDERFLVNLAGPRGATVGDGQGAGTITDDDAPPAVSVADSAVTEGDSDDVVASFAVSLSAPSGRPVTVDYATVDDSATAPGDYAPKSGSVTFAPGDVSETVTVAVRGDLLDEPDERFVVRLANPVAAGVADGEGAGTISDNDAPPALDIGDVSVVEGDGGERDAIFAVSLSVPSGRPVSVDVATGDDSAVAPGDYESRTATVVFAAGETSKTVAVKVRGDVLDEPDERFSVNLVNPANATVADGQGIATITDDDLPPTRSDGGGAPAGGGGPGGAPGGGAPAGGGARPGLRPGAPGTRCGDLTRPRSSVSKRSRLTRKRISLTGRTTDRECSAEGKVIRTKRRLARVEVSIAARAGKRCRFLTAGGALSAPRGCARPLFVRAQIVSFDAKQAKTAWRLAQRVKLPRGRYTVYVRGTDLDGNTEQAKRRSNRASFPVR